MRAEAKGAVQKVSPLDLRAKLPGPQFSLKQAAGPLDRPGVVKGQGSLWRAAAPQALQPMAF